MTNDVAGLLVSAMAIQANVEAMKVANAYRESQGFAQAYAEESFQYAVQGLDKIAKAILEAPNE